jgi:hypothetical protein
MQQYQLPQQQLQGQVAGQPGMAGAMVMPGMVLQEETEVITRKKLQELVGQISSGEVLDPEVEEVSPALVLFMFLILQ